MCSYDIKIATASLSSLATTQSFGGEDGGLEGEVVSTTPPFMWIYLTTNYFSKTFYVELQLLSSQHLQPKRVVLIIILRKTTCGRYITLCMRRIIVMGRVKYIK